MGFYSGSAVTSTACAAPPSCRTLVIGAFLVPQDASSPNPDLAIESSGSIRARQAADEHHLGNGDLVLHVPVCDAHVFSSPAERSHVLLVADRIESSPHDKNRVEASLERLAIAADLLQNEVHPVFLLNKRKAWDYLPQNSR